jgi:hypothetical protein
MSYEGSTTRAPKHAYQWLNNNLTTPPSPFITNSFRYIGNARQEIRSTFNSMWLSLQGVVAGANTSWTYHFEGSTLLNNNHLVRWCMYDSNSTLAERWAVPYSYGLASSRYYTRTSFNHTTGNTQNRYTAMEW